MSDIDTRNVTTPTLGLNQPDVGGDVDDWGNLLNANADVLDGALLTTGGTMSGKLQLSAGMAFGSVWPPSDDPTNLSLHIALYSNTYGLSVSVGRQNYVVPQTSEHALMVGDNDILQAGEAGVQIAVALTVTGDPLAPAVLTLANSSAAAPCRLAWQPVGLTAWDAGTDASGEFTVTDVSGGKTAWQIGTGLRQFWFDANGVAQMTLDTTGVSFSALNTSGPVTMQNLPTTKPAAGSGIVWNNGGVLCVA